MLTNTYLPVLGGVSRSVASFTETLRERGHRVLVVAPTFPGMPEEEEEVIRIPAIQRFNGSDFSVRLPIPGLLLAQLGDFRPDIIHSHHPFLLGDTALRVAATYDAPIVFTHHTMYEQYTHYVPGDSPAMKRFVVALATEYANLCDQVIAPSESIAKLLRERGVSTPLQAIPTGIRPERFQSGNGGKARQAFGIPADAVVIGHVGRLAPEKNLGFLSAAVADRLEQQPRAFFLVVGEGPSAAEIRQRFSERGLNDRLRVTGQLDAQPLADAYHAMDLFAFASQSETQGMVLAEAMTAGVPVVAVDAVGAREVVSNGVNGRLLPSEEAASFTAALAQVEQLPDDERQQMIATARRTGDRFSMARSVDRLIDLYQQAAGAGRGAPYDDSTWSAVLRRIEKEWEIWTSFGSAFGDAMRSA